jgi:hypothetical protein
VDDVVTLAPAWGASAVGEAASLIAYDEGSAERAADGASFASDVEDLTFPVEDDGK